MSNLSLLLHRTRDSETWQLGLFPLLAFSKGQVLRGRARSRATLDHGGHGPRPRTARGLPHGVAPTRPFARRQMSTYTCCPPASQTAEELEVQAWLASGDVEDVLEPTLPMCDPHHHLWDREATAMVRGATAADELPPGFVNFFGRSSPEL